MRTLCAAAGILLLVATTPAGAQTTLAPADGPRHVLIADGRARATIVLPEKPHELETYAAGELARYAQAITGAALPIVGETDPPTGYGLWLGATEKIDDQATHQAGASQFL